MPIINTVTPDMINNFIASEHYYTAGQAVEALGMPAPEPLKLLTFCVLTLKNGFTVTGQSACADPAKFDEAKGKEVAKAKAVEQIWPLMGYALRNILSGSNGLLQSEEAYQDRVKAEATELNVKIENLKKFLATDTFKVQPKIDKQLLWEQKEVMETYLSILKERTARF